MKRRLADSKSGILHIIRKNEKEPAKTAFSKMNGKKSGMSTKPAFKRACDQNIYEALLLANQMIDLADKGDRDREDAGCGILYGILRDSGYKLKKAAEREKKSHIRKGFWREKPGDPDISEKDSERSKLL